VNDFFTEAMDYVLEVEGKKFTNDPADSGGPTKFGITLKTFEQYHKRRASVWEIETMTEAEARSMYFALFWAPLKCYKFVHMSMALCVFSSAVLYGQGTAALMAQKICINAGAKIKLDGILGDESYKYLNEIEPVEFLKAFHKLVLKRNDVIIERRPKDERFRKGWTNRADKLLSLIKYDKE